MDRKMPSLGIAGSVLMVVGGCTVAGYGDLDFSSSGYTIAILCAMLQAAYILVIEHTGASNTSAGEMMFYNAVTGIPVLMINVFYDEEWLKALVMYDLASKAKGAALVGIFIFLSVFSEFALNGSLILCTIHNTGLTTSIVGVLKGVFAVILGFFLLGGVKFSLLNVMGITLAMLGGLVYVLIKHLSSRQSARLAAARQAASSSGRLSP
jgi:solute carrier family 35 protein